MDLAEFKKLTEGERRKRCDEYIAFGEAMAIVYERKAKDLGLTTHECVLSVPAFVSMMLRRLTKPDPGNISSAGGVIIELTRKYIAFDEGARLAAKEDGGGNDGV